MMGVALPDLPPSTSDGNINLGEKDSIRRRALWALEGKPDLAFSKVEIPDISTADMDKMLFDLCTYSCCYSDLILTYPSLEAVRCAVLWKCTQFQARLFQASRPIFFRQGPITYSCRGGRGRGRVPRNFQGRASKLHQRERPSYSGPCSYQSDSFETSSIQPQPAPTLPYPRESSNRPRSALSVTVPKPTHRTSIIVIGTY